MTIKDLLDVDSNIVALDIDIRDYRLRLLENIRIGGQVEASRHDKFASQDGDATVYEMIGTADNVINRTCIRREIQDYFVTEFDKDGQTKPRKYGIIFKNIPKDLLGLKIFRLQPATFFYRPYTLGSEHGWHGYTIWAEIETDNYKPIDTAPLFKGFEIDPNQVSFDDLEVDE